VASKVQTLLKNPSPLKLKMISIMFLVAGAWGVSVGIFYFKEPSFFLTAIGLVNLMLGVFLGFRQLRKDNSQIDKKK
jgi:hypothetical protein